MSSEPTPPGSEPTLPNPTATPQDQSRHDNRRIALRYILDSITEATQELERIILKREQLLHQKVSSVVLEGMAVCGSRPWPIRYTLTLQQ